MLLIDWYNCCSNFRTVPCTTLHKNYSTHCIYLTHILVGSDIKQLFKFALEMYFCIDLRTKEENIESLCNEKEHERLMMQTGN